MSNATLFILIVFIFGVFLLVDGKRKESLSQDINKIKSNTDTVIERLEEIIKE